MHKSRHEQASAATQTTVQSCPPDFLRFWLIRGMGIAMLALLAAPPAGAKCDERDFNALGSRIAADNEAIHEISRLNGLGLELKEKNRSPDALEPIEQAEKIARDRLPADHLLHVTVRQNLAAVLDDLGRLGEALKLYQEALKLTDAWPDSLVIRCWSRVAPPGAIRADQVAIATLHHNLGDILGRMNRNAEAIAHWSEAIRVRQQVIPDDPLVARALLGKAVVLNRTGRYEEGGLVLDQALALMRRIGGNPTTLARILNSYCFIHNNTNRPDVALPLCVEALQLEEQSAGSRSVNLPSFLSNLAESHRQLGHPEQSGALLTRAVVLAEASQRPAQSWLANSNLLKHFQIRGQTTSAIVFGKRAIELTQQMRDSLGSLNGSFSQDFMQDKYKTYRLVADLLVAEGRTTEALQVLDLLREEEALDYSERTAAVPGRTLARSAPEQALLNSFATAAGALAQDEARLDKLRRLAKGRSLSEAERKDLADLSAVLVTTREKIYGRLASWSFPARTAGAAAPVVPPVDLPKDTAFLGYVVSEGRTWVYWNEGADTQVLELPVTRQWLGTRLLELNQSVEKPSGKNPELVLNELYRALFQPIEGRIHAHNIVLAPVDDVRYVPFAALHDGNDYLIRRYTFQTYAPGVANGSPAAAPRTKGLLGFGLTRASAGMHALPGVVAEMCGIVRGPIHGEGMERQCTGGSGESRGAVDGEGYLNETFTEGKLLAAANGRNTARFLHIATHFALGANDSQSFLVLDRDTRFGLDRLRHADFAGVDTLTLSACDTAKVPGGSQFQGFAAYARSRGVRQVVASQWHANDLSTPLLMAAFYRALSADRATSTARALRSAQLAVLDHRAGGQRPYAHPYHWGGFVVFADSAREQPR